MTAVFPGDHEAGIRVLGDRRPRRGVPARLLRLASDERLVEGIRGGSEAAFEVLFDRYHRGVLGFCRHMLGSVEEAEDAVQHTFLSAYRELVGSDKHVVLRPWLYTIARNRCLTMLRGRVRQAGGELVEPPTEHLAAAVERRHDLRDLLRDVAGLPEEQRSALVLSEIGDMSHDEIADVLGCRRDKVKALVFQARSSLIASRQARDTPCVEIREQLANLRGGSLRRNELRRHVSECAGCQQFRDEIRAQRRDLALVLPVAPTIGLKSGVIGAAIGTSAPTAVATGGGAASGALAAKVLVAVAVAGGGTVAVETVADRADEPARAPAPAHHKASAAPAPRGAPVVTPLRGAPEAPASNAAGKGHAKPVPPDHAAKGAAPARERPVHSEHPGKSATAPGHANDTLGPGNSANAPGHLRANGHGKPETAAQPANPPKAERPAKPEKAAKPGKAPKPAKGPKASSAPKASKPAKALKPAKASEPAAASKPVTAAKPDKASKPLKAPKPAKPPKVSKPPKAAEPVAAPPAAAPATGAAPGQKHGKKP